MYLSRIHISNFRNFSELDVTLAGNVVVVGENRVGKSNLLHALRLIFDPTVPDSSRQLGLSDFWDGLGEVDKDDKIMVFVEIKDFESDLDILAILTDFRLNDDPETVRLTYEFRPRADLDGDPSSEQDYEFVCYGGEDEAKQFGHDLRRRITMDLLPALRDTESDLGNWRRSPLRLLIESAFSGVDQTELQDVADAVESVTDNGRRLLSPHQSSDCRWSHSRAGRRPGRIATAGGLNLNAANGILQHQTLMVEIFFVKWTIVKLFRLRRARVIIDFAPGIKSIRL